jgi:hyperosmotically inducible periplasmic protein
MKVLEHFKLIGISTLFVVGLAACDKPGPAETAGKKIDQTADEAGVVINDAAITSKVKAAFFAEPGLKTLQISVDTVKGVVTLSGSVDSLASSDRAKALAGAVAGVNKVENGLVLKSVR